MRFMATPMVFAFPYFQPLQKHKSSISATQLRNIFVKNSNLFYQYYDALFQSKNYAKEVSSLLTLAKKYGISKPQKVLEIGCGTGNHTIHLAKQVKDLIALDTDPLMIQMAVKKIKLKKIKNVRIENTSLETLRYKDFDLATAIFNVINYIPTYSQLISFTKGVASSLRKDGLFIFDCWNGIAGILDPPKSKKTIVADNGKKITCLLTPKTDFFNQRTTLTYRLSVSEGKVVKKGTYLLTHTLWTPMQIKDSLSQAGLEIKQCSPLMKINQAATAKDWKILFCCKKSG